MIIKQTLMNKIKKNLMEKKLIIFTNNKTNKKDKL